VEESARHRANMGIVGHVCFRHVTARRNQPTLSRR